MVVKSETIGDCISRYARKTDRSGNFADQVRELFRSKKIELTGPVAHFEKTIGNAFSQFVTMCQSGATQYSEIVVTLRKRQSKNKLDRACVVPRGYDDLPMVPGPKNTLQ